MHACMHAYQNDNEKRERGKITLKKKTSQNKQKIPFNSVANMQEQQQSHVTVPK